MDLVFLESERLRASSGYGFFSGLLVSHPGVEAGSRADRALLLLAAFAFSLQDYTLCSTYSSWDLFMIQLAG